MACLKSEESVWPHGSGHFAAVSYISEVQEGATETPCSCLVLFISDAFHLGAFTNSLSLLELTYCDLETDLIASKLYMSL